MNKENVSRQNFKTSTSIEVKDVTSDFAVDPNCTNFYVHGRLGWISSMFYVQLFPGLIPKSKKILMILQYFLRFWDLRA